MEPQKNNKIWFLLCGMIGLPFLMPLILPEPYSTFGMIIASIGMIFLIRKFSMKITSSLFHNKIIWVCSACDKQHKNAECPRCGSKQRKMR